MKIDIQKTKDHDMVSFSRWLLSRMKKVLLNSINYEKCIKFDDILQTLLNTNKSTYSILKDAVYHLGIREYKDYFCIEFDNKKFNSYTYSQIVNLITFGNLSVSNYVVFEEVFKHFTNNLSTYYTLWKGSN